MTKDFLPYKDRREHDYINRMTVIIAKFRLAMKTANLLINELQEVVEDHIRVSRHTRKDI